MEEFREVMIKLDRVETSSYCEVSFGETQVAAAVTGEIVAPFPDKASEGFLLFSTEISDNKNITHSEISRYLERTIRHSDALDLESLCIIGGEKVWQVRCQLHVLDTSGGNILDVAMLAAMGALRAFRRPDISVVSVPVGTGLQLSSKIVLHHSDDREPLPLALQHTPLSLTLGIFKRVNAVNSLASEQMDTNKASCPHHPSSLAVN
jgi:exosome complex component RRP45